MMKSLPAPLSTPHTPRPPQEGCPGPQNAFFSFLNSPLPTLLPIKAFYFHSPWEPILAAGWVAAQVLREAN